MSFDVVKVIPIFSGGENPLVSAGVVALGPRWLAFQDVRPKKERASAPTGKNSKTASPGSSLTSMIPANGQDMMWVMGNAIVDLSSSIRGLSKSENFESDPNSRMTLPDAGKEEGGSVTIIDLVPNESDQEAIEFPEVSHFTVNKNSPLSCLTFSPNGTLLAAAHERGNFISVKKSP